MADIKTKGIVVSEMPVGENDKRLVMLTKDKGKIVVFARGARKTTSMLLAGSQLFAYGDFVLYKGKSAYTMKHVQLIESFHAIRHEIELLAYGLYVLEFGEYISEENNPNTALMKLMLKTLQVLVKGKINQELIMRIFELKAMSYIGYTPCVTHCVECGKTDMLDAFSNQLGGVLCKTCGVVQKSTVAIRESTIYTLHYILATPIEQLFTFKVDDGIMDELKRVMIRFIGYHLDHEFKSLNFLLKL
ncbi:DNA repair protein RecO [Vallitalea pronyensis]|uniref:DNA repair protein RecO n=1 Tax=Vallitalea pronyensis TaxID=1348613 RepID=A0A8J8MJH9_9FIRM|nr:DNA repair protein RecO [Vallitalea pronyensis]QUI22815.1 DNA repair protein RecO [Vallitalea pronyensis]